MRIHRLDYISGRGHVIVATVKKPLATYIGAKVEFGNQLWEIIGTECLLKPMIHSYRDTEMPVGLIVRRCNL